MDRWLLYGTCSYNSNNVYTTVTEATIGPNNTSGTGSGNSSDARKQPWNNNRTCCKKKTTS